MRYRKKPVEIEAMQVTADNSDRNPDGSRTFLDPNRRAVAEFYPCKPDIFEATYEPVEASA